ncbi:MAG: hypothetical protein OQK81_04565 [Candidatus Bathyarchaeota archaeon]|nr:hypothetical protein [Candidatus Bathyarchaeota archaeon]
MFERKISRTIEQTYYSLEKILVDGNCKINVKDPPSYVEVTQGSLMGVSPMSAKKVVSFSLSADGSTTKVQSSSQISSDWKNLTLYGNVITAFVIGVFLWITLDMNNYIQTAKPGFWAWIAQIFESPNMETAILVSNLIQALAVFLVFVVLIEILIVIYVYPRKNAFSQYALEKISN